jgi:hypothetical protein
MQKTKTAKKLMSLAIALSLMLALFTFIPASVGAFGDTYSTISAGKWHTMAIKSDGSLWAWGNNSVGGQLGDGTTTDRYAPVHVMDNVAQVSAGEYHTMAIKNDGSLWAWGVNVRGQLGDSSTDRKSTPVHIMDDVAQVSAGGEYTMAIKTDGSLWAWGYNGYGQLGDGMIEEEYRHTPVFVMDNVAQVSAGGEHTMAIKTDGSLWVWGTNGYGQLGDGTITNSYTPVKIMDGGATEQPTSQPSSQQPQTATQPSQPPKTPRIGEPIGDVVYTSITAYIDGQPIPISNINGYAQIIVEDLAGYGFDVAWNAAEKTLKVERNKDKAMNPLPFEGIPPGKKPGDLKAKYVMSAIKVYLSGMLVESYSINGYMFIDFELLKIYGAVTWDNANRILSCKLY